MDRSEHERIFEEGIEIKAKRLTHPTTTEDAEEAEKLLLEFSEKFWEEAVLTYWVQPYGGPVMYVKIQRRSEADRVHNAYERGELREVCPQLGIYRDVQWCKDERTRMVDPSKRTPPDKLYGSEFVDFLKNFYSNLKPTSSAST